MRVPELVERSPYHGPVSTWVASIAYLFLVTSCECVNLINIRKIAKIKDNNNNFNSWKKIQETKNKGC